MPRKITYGVAGLLDWTAVIPVGKARMQVHFSGGAITKYGVVPAEYTTTDPLTQRIIENSAYYRSGKITTLRSVGRPDTVPLSRHAPKQVKDAYDAATLDFDKPQPSDPCPVLRTIEVPCLEDAIEYMRDHHGVSSVSVRTMESLTATARQYGIAFKFSS